MINIDALFSPQKDIKISELYTPEDLHKAVESSVINLNEQYEKDRFIMHFQEDNQTFCDVMSLGNISVSVGGAKSRKTFFSTMLLSGFISDRVEFGFKGNLEGKRALLIDTEQSKYHVQKVARRIKTITGKNLSDYIDVLAFRDIPDMKMRLAMLEYHLNANQGEYSFVCIDGIVDLVNDFNNQEECRKVVGLIMSWSSIYDCHINSVIHTNKDKGYARGHLGAELINKSEVAFRINKEDINTSVKCEASRNAPFSDFEFNVNDNGLPERMSFPSGYFDNEPKSSAEIAEIKANDNFEDEVPF